MGRLVYAALCSLDGYTADEDGSFDWAAPGEELHGFVNEMERGLGTYLYGRRMYEVMRFWEDADALAGEPEVMQEYGRIWRAADKVVYSSTLDAVTTDRTRLERSFDPGAVREMKESSDRDLGIGGPTLAAGALRAGLVDDVHLLIAPVVVGGGLQVFPDGLKVSLELVDERRFGDGVVHLRYRTT
jgi:dihydrofolate reductase